AAFDLREARLDPGSKLGASELRVTGEGFFDGMQDVAEKISFVVRIGFCSRKHDPIGTAGSTELGSGGADGGQQTPSGLAVPGRTAVADALVHASVIQARDPFIE